MVVEVEKLSQVFNRDMEEVNTLEGEKIFLRALEPMDLDYLYKVENNESIWKVSNTHAPFSRFILSQYLENAHLDIYEAKQLRMVICKLETNEPIGFVDLFDFEPKHFRVGIGIVIDEEKDRQKGYASEAIKLCVRYAFTHANVHQVHATITEDNIASMKLFEKAGFTKSGVKKDWIFHQGEFKDEFIYQLIKDVY